MKKIWKYKEYLLIGLVIVLFVLMSFLSLTSINHMRGNARVVNYAGIVRGATQRLMKQELMGYPNDTLVKRLDSIITDLIHGGGANNLVALKDDDFQNNMQQVESKWQQLKEEIVLVRAGGDNQTLFDLSEEYFEMVDLTVSSAEAFSEKQVNTSTQWMLGVSCVFVVLIAVGAVIFIRSAALKRRAEVLGKMAYLDILTQMPNRASCEQAIDKYSKNPPEETMAAFMFDMNNLKLANDLLGHHGGDRIIADFARIIKTEAEDFGFVGRYGGDEFVALFPNCDQAKAERYLAQINEKAIAYNLLHVQMVEKLSFAVGYTIESPQNMTVVDMINDADRKMYIRKRQMKENKEI